ncbi:MAG: hypothetical protein LBD24_09330, partial [Spirochaetaceae bacterium]|nr:hypothetical protein [Spirochaetaceae bacterium]
MEEMENTENIENMENMENMEKREKKKKVPHETREQPKRAFLLGVEEETLRELGGLADTLGLEIVRLELAHIRERHPKFGMGTGKAAEVAE